MKIKDNKKGKPTGNVRVIITETLYGVGSRGKSESFVVYETTSKKLADFIKRKIKEQ